MVNLQAFSIRDSKAELWIQPFFSPTIATACRQFGEVCNEPNENFHKHSDDYTLFHIGTFDQDEGTFTPLSSNTNLGLATSFLTSKD